MASLSKWIIGCCSLGTIALATVPAHAATLADKRYYPAIACQNGIALTPTQVVSATGQVLNEDTNTTAYLCPTVQNELDGPDFLVSRTITVDGFANSRGVAIFACHAFLNGGTDANGNVGSACTPPAQAVNGVFHLVLNVASFPATDYLYLKMLVGGSSNNSFNVIFGYTLEADVTVF